MITKFFTKVTVRFNPFGPEGKPARLFLASIPPSLRQQCQISHEVLTSGSAKKPLISVVYKDKFSLEADPTTTNFNELQALFDRHSRKLQLQETISS